jgi:hypothetical protein
MNERIKELARQADACYIPRYDMWQMDTETLEKFAELIVAECANVAQQHNESPTASIYSVGYVVKKHFGVEE